MKYFDWNKAKEICEQHKGHRIAAGIDEDWFWTASEIFDGEKRIKCDPWLGSYWATPVCRVMNDDGSVLTIPCLTCGDSECGFAGTTAIRDDCKFSCYIPKGEDSMSDCSTEAMRPKELPKTCGSCGNVEVAVHKVRCPHRRYPMERFRDWIGYPRYEHYAEDSACENYVPSNDTLELRCQQLSKLAQDMHRIISSAERNGSTIRDGVSARLLERMEELGVEADG